MGGINEKVRIEPDSAPLHSVIGMMEYRSNDTLSSENGIMVYWQNSLTEINGIIQNSLKII